jgi:rhamnose transport system permease protein
MKNLRWSRELTLVVLLLCLFGAASILEPKFVTMRAQTLLATHLWELALVAIPMLLIVITAGIELSVGSIVALSAVSFGLMFERNVPPVVAVGLTVLVGTVLGSLNGWFVTKMKVHPLLVTLATLAAFRGMAEGISTARAISGYPDWLLNALQGPTPMVLFALVAVATHVVMTQTYFGRWVVAIGTEENVSRFSRIPVDRVKQWLYGFSGLVCGVAAVLLVARNNTAKADMATGLELEAITAVVLGGASIHGGNGRVTGLVLGLLLIHETREFVSWHWKQNELNLIVIGSLLILTVLLENIAERRKDRKPKVAITATENP